MVFQRPKPLQAASRVLYGMLDFMYMVYTLGIVEYSAESILNTVCILYPTQHMILYICM